MERKVRKIEKGEVLYKNANLLLVVLLTTITCIATADICRAGAWTMPKGKMYARVALNYYEADQNYDGDGDRIDFDNNGDFYDVNGSVYLEYGVLNRLTLIANTTYKYLEYENDDLISDSYGMGDIDVAARYLLLGSGTYALSVQGLLKIPEAYDEADDVPLGNGQFDVEFRLLYGQSLYPLIPGYCNAEVGYRFRREEPADEFRYLLELGIDMTANSYARVKLDGILGIGNEKQELDMSGNPTVTNDFDLAKLDVCIGYKISEAYGIELAYTPSVYGENTAVGTTWTIAVVFRK